MGAASHFLSHFAFSEASVGVVHASRAKNSEAPDARRALSARTDGIVDI